MNNNQPVSETQSNGQPKSSPRASIGKIASLPADIREEINTRLYNGQHGPEILPWLNGLPPVKEILAARFAGAPVNDPNLSSWRASGYRRWLAEQKDLAAIKNLGKHAADMANAAGGGICRGAAAIASGKILEFLQKTPDDNATPEELIKLTTAAAHLLKGEQNGVRLTIAHERLRQQERHLLLMRDKHQRDRVALALHILGDAHAKEIEAADCDNAEKIELLGLYLFGDLWEPRLIPQNPPNL